MKIQPTALVKCSSRLLGNEQVIDHLRIIERNFAVRFIGGGGEQINAEFEKRGWPIRFGPFGRICTSHEQRLLAADILEKNAAVFEDQLKGAGIAAQVIVPVMRSDVGGVTCHVNGDLYPIICYNGYDKFFVFTGKKDVERKQRWYDWMWQISKFHLGDGGEIPLEYKLDDNAFPEKIDIIGLDLPTV